MVRGTQMSISALIGNSIGANKISLAKRYLRINSIFAGIIVLCIALTTLLNRETFIGFYTDDEDVIETGAKVMIVQQLFYSIGGI